MSVSNIHLLKGEALKEANRQLGRNEPEEKEVEEPKEEHRGRPRKEQ